MEKIIDNNLNRLEHILGIFTPSNHPGILVLEKYSTKSAIKHLLKALRIMGDTKNLLLAMSYENKPEPVFMSLIDSAKLEMQECLQSFQRLPTERRLQPINEKERKTIGDAIFSGIIALQLFIAP